MAKPILVVRVGKDITPEAASRQAEKLNQQIGSEYHVLFILTQSEEDVKFECVNDCKGLPDVDIEQMIKDLKSV
jgi:hypothetical protein